MKRSDKKTAVKTPHPRKPPSSTHTIRLPVTWWDEILKQRVDESTNATVVAIIADGLAARGVVLPVMP